MSGGPIPPGWYPDPWYPGVVRWFDGTDWTPHAAPMGPGAFVEPYDAEKGRSTAAMARWAFLARGLASGIVLAIGPVAFAHFWSDVNDSMRSDRPMVPFGGTGFAAFNLTSQLLSLVIYATLVFVCIWTYRATKNARLLGLRTTLAPGWAVAGWLIPLANYVMPYLAVRDAIPAHHPGRRDVAVWWGVEVTGVVLSFLAYAFAFTGTTTIPAVLGGIAGLCVMVAGALGYRLCGTVRDAQAELARERGFA